MKLTKTITFTLEIPDGLEPELIWEEFMDEFDFSGGTFYPEADQEREIEYTVTIT
jgi:hypothetical protein